MGIDIGINLARVQSCLFEVDIVDDGRGHGDTQESANGKDSGEGLHCDGYLGETSLNILK